MSYYKFSLTVFLGIHVLLWGGYALAEMALLKGGLKEWFEMTHCIIQMIDVIFCIMLFIYAFFAFLSFFSDYFNHG